ncbi:T9SS type A sorting domain-containing protein [Olleya aquimaris]|uniref:Putative secreted protein (Por secretion system target) n=1 Tax=Olleya aquimaris TaxID=639310 RepID=A0A327RKH2_9FLAO|nr:T9SS type A sorting domain-containing protein [Olleya aquimaris]RAJ16911.1 putative secreted protein (Por secretion system target) [Olleya aquimaris]
MRKITLLLFLLTAPFAFSQTWSTGVVTLDTDYSVQFDITSTTVTMTMIGPSDRWLGVALTNTNYSSGGSMGQFSGDDAVIFVSNSLSDRFMPGGNGTPGTDADQDWMLSTNTVNGSVRTVVGTRDRDTGDANDFVFPASDTNFVVVWAKGSANSQNSLAYHGGGRNATMASTTLSVPTFEDTLTAINVYPNPASTTLNIDIPNRIDEGITIEVYNVLGKRILLQTVNQLNTSLSISSWNDGVYLMKISSLKDGKSVTKRFVKI